MKKMSQNALVGIGIGSTIYLITGIFFTSGEVRKNSLLVLLMGAVIGLISTIYESEKLSLLVKALCQLIGSYLVFLSMAYFGNWFPFQIGIVLTASLLFFVIFFIIWTVFYFKEKKELAKINCQLDKQSDS